MMIRKAEYKDIDALLSLLSQVLAIHHNGRPDIFKDGGTKYTREELAEILQDEIRPVFVAADKDDRVMGYCFCIFKEKKDSNVLCDVKTLYIDDLCVDEDLRGQHVGSALYRHVCNFAKECGCYNVTLNVWALNESAAKFYEHLGMKPQKICMEEIL